MFIRYSLIGLSAAAIIWALSDAIAGNAQERIPKHGKLRAVKHRRLGSLCKDWCDDIELPWIADVGEHQKCDWINTCAGCSACGRDSFEEGLEEEEKKCRWFCRTKKWFKRKYNEAKNYFKKKEPEEPKGTNTTETNKTGTAVASAAFSDEAGGNIRGPCKDWCADNEIPWIAAPGEYQKCNWLNTCSGCSACPQTGAVGAFFFEEKEDVKCRWWEVRCRYRKWKENEEKKEEKKEDGECPHWYNIICHTKKLFKKKDDKPDTGKNETATNETATNITMAEKIFVEVETETEVVEKSEEVTVTEADKPCAFYDLPCQVQKDAEASKEEEEHDEEEVATVKETFEEEIEDETTESILEQASDCKDWCSGAKAPWQPTENVPNHKCGWKGHCSGCAECYEDAQ